MDRRGARFGARYSPADFDKLLTDLPGGPPAYQFRADTVDLSGVNVASIPNRRGSDALVLSAGTLAAPVRSGAFRSKYSLLFNSSQWLDSDIAPAAWSFGHNGDGVHVFHVSSPNTTSGTKVWLGTQTGSGSIGFSIANANALMQARVGNGANIVNAFGGTLAAGVAASRDFYYGESASPEYVLRNGQTLLASGSTTGAPSASDPTGTLRLGAQTDGANGAIGVWSESIIFDRVLAPADEEIVYHYLYARYGV